MLNLWFVRIYLKPDDWAGVGYKHFLIAWTWRGLPRSITIPIFEKAPSKPFNLAKRFR
jgi:hypothetical protein